MSSSTRATLVVRLGALTALTIAVCAGCSESPSARSDGGGPSADGVAGVIDSGDNSPPIAGLGVSLSRLKAFVGGRGGALVWVEGADRAPKVLDFRKAQPKVEALSSESGWMNPIISPDGTRVVYSKGAPSSPKPIVVQRLDGGEGVEVGTNGDVGYWQVGGDGEHIVYAEFSSKHENGADGKTFRRKLVTGDVQPDGEAEQLCGRAMDGGPNGAGTWLGQVYNNLWAYDVAGDKEYPFAKFSLLDGGVADHQSCNGSMAPDATARLMTLVIPHDYVRIYSYVAADDAFKETSRFLLPEGMAEWEYPEWSTDPGYFTAILMKPDRKHRLFIGKVKEGEVVPELLQVSAEPSGDAVGASYSHLYLD